MPTIKESQDHEMGTEEQMGLNTKEEMTKQNWQAASVEQQPLATQPTPPIQQPLVPNPPFQRSRGPARRPIQRQGRQRNVGTRLPNRYQPAVDMQEGSGAPLTGTRREDDDVPLFVSESEQKKSQDLLRDAMDLAARQEAARLAAAALEATVQTAPSVALDQGSGSSTQASMNATQPKSPDLPPSTDTTKDANGRASPVLGLDSHPVTISPPQNAKTGVARMSIQPRSTIR